MDVARAVDSPRMSEHLLTRWHHGAALSQRRSDFEDFRVFPCFQLIFERILLENVHNRESVRKNGSFANS